MDRPVSARWRVAAPVAALAAAYASPARAAETEPVATAAPPPTIVTILLDDLDARSVAEMPKTTALLGEEGVTFANFFATQPGCSPSRASLLRGQYPHNHGVVRSSQPLGGFVRFHGDGLEDSTLATWLRDAGYRTALIGKYFNEYPETESDSYIPPGWDDWFATLDSEDRKGGVNFRNYYVNDNGDVRRYGNTPAEYSTDGQAARAVDVLRAAAADDMPLFLYIAPRAPHKPARPAARHEKMFADATAPRLPSFDEEDVSDKPQWIQASPRLTGEEIDEIDQTWRNRVESLQAVDDLVEAVVAALDETGRLDDAWIFFLSDNGYFLGEHRQFDEKGAPHEESIRVPLFVRGPGVTIGGVVEQRLAGMADIAPTIAAIAGAAVPGFVDGRSLLPLLRGDDLESPWRSAILVEQPLNRTGMTQSADEDGGNGVRHPGWAALRREADVYVEYADGQREYYDLAADPYQLDNAADGLPIERTVAFSAQVAALGACAGATCRAAEDDDFGDPASVPPMPVILAPGPNTAAGLGGTVALAGTAYDGFGRTIDPANLSWSARIVAPAGAPDPVLLPRTEGGEAVLNLPEHAADPAKGRSVRRYVVEISLTATDAAGRDRTSSVLLTVKGQATP